MCFYLCCCETQEKATHAQKLLNKEYRLYSQPCLLACHMVIIAQFQRGTMRDKPLSIEEVRSVFLDPHKFASEQEPKSVRWVPFYHEKPPREM